MVTILWRALLLNRKEELRLLDAQIAACEAKLKLLHAEVDREWCMRFSALMAQTIYLRKKYVECQACKEDVLIHQSCLESRIKTGKCVFEVGVDRLEKLSFPKGGGFEFFVSILP